MDNSDRIAKLEQELNELKSTEKTKSPSSAPNSGSVNWGAFLLYVAIIGGLSLFATSEAVGGDMFTSMGKAVAFFMAIVVCIPLSKAISESEYLKSKSKRPFLAGMTMKGFLLGLVIYVAASVVNVTMLNSNAGDSRAQCLKNLQVAYTTDWNNACASYGLPNGCQLPAQVGNNLNNTRASLETRCK